MADVTAPVLEATTVEELKGEWELTGYGYLIHNEVPSCKGLEGDAYYAELTRATNAWMDDHPEELPEVTAHGGLKTTINDEGLIQDSGEVGDMVYWDAWGAQSQDLFEGRLEEIDDRVFAFSDEMGPNDYQHCADDSAYVTDEFFRNGESADGMVRVVSVVFDGMYLYRMVYTYERA